MHRAFVSRLFPIFVAIFLSLSCFPPTNAEAHHKLGSQLRSFKKVKITKNNIQDVSKKGYFKLFMKNKRPFVGVLIKAEPGAEATLREFGAENVRRHGQIYTADVPVDSLEELSGSPEILYMRAARKLQADLDVSVPILPLDSVGLEVEREPTVVKKKLTYPPLSWSTGSGAGIVFGLVDSGIDYTHQDFQVADGNGETRIKSIWDQDTGEFCDETDINSLTCSHVDDEHDGHGTHVTGIAAGNGQATAPNLPNYRYVGVAPEADIIAVSTTFWDDDILDGVAYIFDIAEDTEQAAVVNLSLGGHFGPHDGTDPFDVGLDTMAGPGQIVVTSAGNEGDEYIHNQGTWSDSAVNFRFEHHPLDEYIYAGDIEFTLWHNGLDSYQVRIKSPWDGDYTWDVGETSTQTFDFLDETHNCQVHVANPGYDVTEYNGDKEITISLSGWSSSGTWDIWLIGDDVNAEDPNQIDAWIYWDDLETTQFTNGDNNISVGSPGTAKSVITVGAYTTKDVWRDSRNKGWTYHYTKEDITPFSSLGPTRDGRLKPDIVAPGSVIGSALSGATSPADPYILDDGVHRVMQGTSMSCPHIAGLSALLLEKHPTYTPAAIKSILAFTARADAYVDLPPNDTWGYGKADAADALALAEADRPHCASAEQYPTTAVADNTLVAQGVGFESRDDGTDAPERYFYQWQKHNGHYFENIPGANYKRLEPQQFSEGDEIRAVVTPYEDVDDSNVEYQDLLLGASQVVEHMISAGASYASHTGQEAWSMISIPTQDDSAVKDDFIIPLFSWNEASQVYEEVQVDSNVERGTGYWAYVLPGEGYMHSAGDAVPAGDYITPQLTCTAGSYAGRHLLGNPFNKPIYWENLYVSASSDPASFTVRVTDPEAAALVDNMYYAEYDNTEGQYHYYDLDDFEQRDGKIFPWEGFWIIANQAIYLMIPETQSVPDSVRAYGDYPLPVYAQNHKAGAVTKSGQHLAADSENKGKGGSSAKKPKGPKNKDPEVSNESWRMKIGALSGQLRDDYNYVGMHPDSVNGHDPKDMRDAGTMNSAYVMLFMEHNDWDNWSGKYCVDMHSNAGKRHHWEMTARATGLVDPVTIFWKKVPSGWDLELVDLTSQLQVDMNNTNSYTYSPNGDEERSFVVTARKSKQQ